jgi:hypothetical protein
MTPGSGRININKNTPPCILYNGGVLMINVRADIYTRKIEKTFMYNGSQMLKIDIEYPNVKLSHGGVVQSRIK